MNTKKSENMLNIKVNNKVEKYKDNRTMVTSSEPAYQ